MRLGVHTSDRRTSRLAALALAAPLLLGVAACSGDDEPGDQPAASGSTSASASATPGAEITSDVATFEAPSGFEAGETTGKGAVIATSPTGGLVSLVVVDFPSEAPDLDRQAEIALDGLGRKFTLEDPVEVDGVEMWHAAGKESKGSFADVYGAIRDEQAVRLTIRLSGDDYSPSEMDTARQQVLDSWTWND